MDIYDILTDEPIEKALREAVASDPNWLHYGDRLIELVTFLKAASPDVRVYAMLNEYPPRLFLSGTGSGTNDYSIELWADRFDGPSRAASPFHFRMQITCKSRSLSEDIRTNDLREIARRICEAFDIRD
jgi:hypothetical protein